MKTAGVAAEYITGRSYLLIGRTMHQLALSVGIVLLAGLAHRIEP
jgi:hypothetical protein